MNPRGIGVKAVACCPRGYPAPFLTGTQASANGKLKPLVADLLVLADSQCISDFSPIHKGSVITFDQ